MKDKLTPAEPNRHAGRAVLLADSAVGQQLLPLARSGSPARAALELDDGRIVLIEKGFVYLVKVKQAPDGEYSLLTAGRVIVKSGKATAVVGQAAAPALSAPVD